MALVPEHFDSHKRIYATTSDADGRFSLKHMAPGSYQFLANRPVLWKAGDEGTGAILSLKAGHTGSDVLFRLTAAAVITAQRKQR